MEGGQACYLLWAPQDPARAEEGLPGGCSPPARLSCWKWQDNTPSSTIKGQEISFPPNTPSQGQGALSTGINLGNLCQNRDGPRLENARVAGLPGACGGHVAGSAAPPSACQVADRRAGLDRGRRGPGS